MGNFKTQETKNQKKNSTTTAGVRKLDSAESFENPILQLQRTVGNRAVAKLLQSSRDDESGAQHADDPGEAARRGIAGSADRLPHFDAIQRSFGDYDVSGVKAHTGVQATSANEELNSVGYTVGNHVAFVGAPDLHTAAHEAAHVVQQQKGVHLTGGGGQAGDDYERHADAVADLVVRGESAYDLLSFSPGPAHAVIQRQANDLKPEKPPKNLPSQFEFEFNRGMSSKKGNWTEDENRLLDNAVRSCSSVIVVGIAYEGFDDEPGWLTASSLPVLAQDRADWVVAHIQTVLSMQGVAGTNLAGLMAKVTTQTSVRKRSKLLGRTEGVIVRC